MKSRSKTLIAREWHVAYDGVPGLGLPAVTLRFVAFPGFWHSLFHEVGMPPQSYCVTTREGKMFANLGTVGLVTKNLSPVSTEFILAAQRVAREAADYAFPPLNKAKRVWPLVKPFKRIVARRGVVYFYGASHEKWTYRTPILAKLALSMLKATGKVSAASEPVHDALEEAIAYAWPND